MLGISASSLQTAIPAILAVLTGLIGFFRVNNKAGRLRNQIKNTLELSKLANDAGSQQAKDRIDQLATEQITRLRDVEEKGANRQYSGSTLGGALVLVIPLSFASWGFFTLSWPPAAIFGWILGVISAIVLVIGIVGFFAPSKPKSEASSA